MTQAQWISVGGSALVIGFFALRAVIYYSRASDRLETCTRTCAYLIAALDENRAPDLRFDSLTVSRKVSDLQAVLQAAPDRTHKKLKFRRTTLDDGQEIRDNLERAKTSTEILPLCGVLGTAVGFLTTNYFGSTAGAVDSGLWLALISTILALAATILLKWGYEGRLVPQFAHYQDQTLAIESSIDEAGIEILERFGQLPTEPAADAD